MECFDTITYYADNLPYRQEVVISLEYPDWCKFEKTPLYRELIEYFHQVEIQHKKRTAREGR